MRNISGDVTIISGDNEEIQSNKYILSIFCPNLTHLLSTSSTFFLPECSTFPIKYLLNLITNGFAVTEKLSNEDLNEIIETAQVLSIEMRELCHDETVPSLVKTNKVAIRIETGKIFGNDANILYPSIINTMSAGRLPSAASDRNPTNLLLAKIKISKPIVHANFCSISLCI